MKNPRIAKSLTEVFEAYNEELPELPKGIKELQDRMIKGSQWDKKSGPYPGVFDNRGVLWSVQWQCSGGRKITPADYWPIDFMTCEALIFEMLEYCERETKLGGDQGRAMSMLNFLLELRALEAGNMRVNQFMEKWKKALPRGSAPEYVCMFDPPSPDKIVILRLRPGWPERGSMLPPREKKIHIPDGWRIAR